MEFAIHKGLYRQILFPKTKGRRVFYQRNFRSAFRSNSHGVSNILRLDSLRQSILL
jgi:hypothetical protein